MQDSDDIVEFIYNSEGSDVEENSTTSEYGICIKCKKARSHYQWCQKCERKQCEENFTKWNIENEEVKHFLQNSQFNATNPQSFLEWIPYDKLKSIKYLRKKSQCTLYSAVWTDGPKILWDQNNQEYIRSEVQVLVIMYHNDHVNGILNELNVYLDCHAQGYPLLIQFYGISKHPVNNEYFIVKQYTQKNPLIHYIFHNFDSLDWEIKLHLLFYLAGDLKALHNAGYVHRNLNPSSNVSVLDNGLCAIETLSRCRKALSLTLVEVFGWQPCIAPEIFLHKPHTKASDIYAFGMIMYVVATGQIPFKSSEQDIVQAMSVCNGVRPSIPSNIPKSYKELMEGCWNGKQDLRPDVSEIHDTLLKWWSSLYHNKCLTPIRLEFLVANDRNDFRPDSLEIDKELDIVKEDVVLPIKKNLEPSEFIDFTIKNDFVKVINIDELSTTTMEYVDSGHFGIISKTIWKKTGNRVVCKRLKNIESISYKPFEAFLHELKMYRRLDFCSRIIRILGISFDENTKEYLFVMEYADSGDLRKYLKRYFSTLNWEDKKKLAYQIAEGIKYLHGENILHRDLHSKNIVIHQGEAKIIDLGIAKSTETETNLHSDVFGMIPYIDPKLLKNRTTYKYDKKSDIYSFGVLMWELSSGKPPFDNIEDVNLLAFDLINGKREDPIPDTPDEYLKLYQSCWDCEPDVRPSIEQVYNELRKMLNLQDDADKDDKDDKDDKNDTIILQEKVLDSTNESGNQSSTSIDIADRGYDLVVPDNIDNIE